MSSEKMPYPRKAIQFTRPQLDWLDARAAELGITVSELTRRIMDEYRGVRITGWKVAEADK